jgi:hypothetical protein
LAGALQNIFSTNAPSRDELGDFIMRSVLALVTFVFLCSFAIGSHKNTYNNFDKDYQITFPNDWDIKRDFMGLDVFVPAPPLSGAESAANISVISGSVPENVNLDMYFKKNLENLKKDLQHFQLLETGTAIIGDHNGKKVVYLHSINSVNIKVAQYFLVHKGQGFIITCAASQDHFAHYANDFQKTLLSFKFH